MTFSQNVRLDSVLNSLSEENDTVKIETLINCYKQYEKGNILEGLAYLDKALEIALELNDKNWEGKVYLKYGNFYSITGDYKKSIDYFKKSKENFEESKRYINVGSSYNNLGATYEKMGMFNEAMDCLIKALNIYEAEQDSENLAKIFLNLGLLYSRQENYEKSIELYNKSLEIRKELNDSSGIALVYNNMAIINYYLGKYDDVRSYFEDAYEIYVKLGDQRRQLMALSNLAEILDIIGQRELALQKYFEILKLEKELGEIGEIAKTHFLIGDLYQSRKEYENAKIHTYKSLEISEEIGALIDMRDAYSQLTKIYKDEENYKEALFQHELFVAMQDSVFNTEKARQIQEIETRYETKKKEQQITNLENEQIIKNLKIKKQRIFLFSFFFGFFLISIFIVVLYKQNQRISNANTILAYQKKQITDSIEYASRIQTAILPPGDYINKIIPDHFILYKPRDIVSGDFYWITHKDGKIIVAAVDCTGHGVPGAFMSMLGFAFLNEIVNKEKELKANEILNQLRDNVKKSLHQTGKDDEAKDGMDIALCIIDLENLKMQFSGAYNPLYLARNNELITLKGDRMPIGIYIAEKESFTNHETEISKGDTIYIFTDGYTDQFGGPQTQKFKTAPFKNLIESNQDKSMAEQKKILEDNFEKWKGDYDQIDDVLVIGIKI
jgi:serine phosphatase RsbU (regulator of sigma subunit)/tetratricopeptide (TPR) repeat protein